MAEASHTGAGWVTPLCEVDVTPESAEDVRATEDSGTVRMNQAAARRWPVRVTDGDYLSSVVPDNAAQADIDFECHPVAER
jgi:hypothetical protein